VSIRAFRLVTYLIAILAFGAAPAFAYRESVTSTNPADTPSYSCPDCHGLESGVTSPTVGGRVVPSSWTWDSEAGLNVGTRKGPHGGYTTGTQKCQVCHTIHGAQGDGLLLSAATIEETCFTCHDGTGGSGVYGVIYQRTGIDPKEASSTAAAGTRGGVHRIGAESINATGWVVVPGGNGSTGAAVETTFTGLNGALTCTDCHSAHNSNTVAPFVGDRKRSSSEITTSGVATNRLLRIKPTSATTTVTAYGTGWCASCHKGGALASNHSVETSDTLRNYSKVVRLAGLNTSVTAPGTGTLGGNNFGYIMPDLISGPGGHGSELPICQQCHEDMRSIGGSPPNADQFFVTNAQAFVAPLDGNTAGNPQFQNFPHESVNDALLVEKQTDGLCLNCHLP
jgi:predicted CXXCH cytochrome family protein